MSTLKLDALLVYRFGCHASKALCLERGIKPLRFFQDRLNREGAEAGLQGGALPKYREPAKCQQGVGEEVGLSDVCVCKRGWVFA